MTGLDKMKDLILKEADDLAAEKLSKAKHKAQEILEAAKTEADKAAEGILKKAEKDAADHKDRVASGNDLMKRTKLLAAKQEVIADILEKSYERLTAMDAEEYFAFLIKLLKRYVRPQDGEIYFSSSDLARMPRFFKAQIESTAVKKGGTLKLSDKGKKIENGFVLIYGGIEENCTLRAVFDSKKDELSDIIHRFLFP